MHHRGMAKVLDKPSVIPDPPSHADQEQTWRQLCDELPDHRVEIISERIVISPVPGPPHNSAVFRLNAILTPIALERGWEVWPDIPLFLGPHLDRFRPDLTVVPPEPPLWGENEIYGHAALMVVEVVSASSHQDDHLVKPQVYGRCGIPLCLVVDPFDKVFRLFSTPTSEGYRDDNKIAFGDPLVLPNPFGLTLDTAKLFPTSSDVGDA